MAAAQVCPVVGATTNALPPAHPHVDASNLEKRCPVTNAKVSHHNEIVHHEHPSSTSIPNDKTQKMDAQLCPALKNSSADIVEDTCPVVGPVSATLPPSHPKLTKEEAGDVCPVTNATLEHHKGKVHLHRSVPENSPAQQCPVAKNMLN